MSYWIDTHCHLDAAEFWPDVQAVRTQAAMNNVAHCVLPAVQIANFEAVRELAQAGGDSYALGIHPLCVAQAQDADLATLDAYLLRYRDDPRLVAVGEIGLDYFVPELSISPLRERQEYFYLEQLKLARKHDLPVLLHVRRSVDRVLKGLRAVAKAAPRGGPGGGAWHGIAHAFNGSQQQAEAFIALGFKLGFGGALTYQRALQLRRLATSLPLEAIVLETDAPDMPPHWLYKTAQQRAGGKAQGRNEPGELPRIGAELAALRGMSPDDLAVATTRNALAALPRLQALLRPLNNDARGQHQQGL
jgi:TatD DNase family protein